MRTPHRGRALRPVQRTALAAALAVAFGSTAVHAATTVVVDEPTLVAAILAANATPTNDCRDQTIQLGDGVSPFFVGVSTPLPTVTCNHLTLKGMPASGYGAILFYSGYGPGVPQLCGIQSSAPVSVLDLELNTFHDTAGTAAGICGVFDGPIAGETGVRRGVRGVISIDNDNGIIVTGPGALIGTTAAGDRNVIYASGFTYGGGDGIRVQGAGSAEIAGNFIGTYDGVNGDANVNGIVLAGDKSSVHDNVISANQTGILVQSSGNSIGPANHIGTSADGSSPLGNSTGIRLVSGADGTTIGGNLISGNGGSGIEVASGGNLISGNTIGLDSTGTSALGNYDGIFILGGSSANTIDANTISGNENYGIQMYGGGSITTNHIGTDFNGTSVLGNWIGVGIFSSSTQVDNNVVGGNSNMDVQVTADTSITNNRISVDESGTRGFGDNTGVSLQGTGAGVTVQGNVIGAYVSIDVASATGGVILQNHIGVDVANNLLASGTRYVGVGVADSSGVSIGSNVVGGQQCAAIAFENVTNATVANNAIGTDPGGTTPLGNFGYGVIASSSASPCIGPPLDRRPPAPGGKAVRLGARTTGVAKLSSAGSNTFTGNRISNNGDGLVFFTGSGSSNNTVQSNIITNNAGSGVAIRDNAGIYNGILSNTIFGNGVKNIELYRDPTTPSLPLVNDDGDVDTGPNEGMNYPEILSVTDNGVNTVVTYQINAPTDATRSFRVQFYTNPTDPGQPGGESFQDETIVSGSGKFTPPAFTFPTGKNFFSLTSTLVDGNGNETSEFSPVATSTPLPNVSVNPATFGFGNVEVGAASPTQTFDVSSTGTAPLTLGGFVTGGTCPSAAPPPPLSCTGGFICTVSCATPTTLPQGSACNITARYSPNAAGPSSLTITVCDNSGKTPPANIQISGNAVLPPPVTVTPNGFDFGTVLVGTSSAPQPFTVTNPAQTSVTLGTPAATSPFSIASTNCTGSLAAGATCNITALFTPTAGGVASGTVGVSFTSSATGATATAAAAVAGIGATSIQLSLPPSLGVGTFTLGLPAPVATATLKNTGAAAAAISSIVASAPFTLSHDCPASLAPGASCTLTITFTGGTAGPVNGTVTLTSAAGKQLMALSGQVAQPAIGLAPASLDFGSVLSGHVSSVQEVGVINTTTVAMPIGAPSISGPFRIDSSTCSSPLPALARCSVQVQFTPAQAGPAAGALSVAYGVAGATAAAPAKGLRAKAASPIIATTTLTGTGVDSAQLDMPGLVDFGPYVVGTPPLVRTVTITSSGNTAVNIADISVSGPFSLASNCPPSLVPGASCTLTITFNSSALGQAAGLVSIRSNAVGGLRTISLGAFVQPKPVPAIDVTPASISFGDRLIGSSSVPVAVTVTNSGAAAAILGSMTVGGDYLITGNTCGVSLAPGTSCSVSVAMRPIGFGPRPDVLSFTSNADGSPHRVTLTGSGCRPFTPSNNRSGGKYSCSP